MTEQAQEATAPESQGTQQVQAQPEYKYTDKDVDKYKGDARKEARNALLKDLGFEKPDDLKSFVNEYRGVQEAAKDDIERRDERIQELENHNREVLAKANARVVSSELRSALMAAGVNPDRLKVAARLADTSEVEVKDDGTVDGLDDVVEGVKDEAPELFGEPKPPTVGRGSAPGGSASARLDFTNMSQAEFEQVQAQVRAGNVIRP